MNIALIGYGKMGRMIEQTALQRGHTIACRIDIDNQDEFASEAFRSADVAIEFTSPQSAWAGVQKCFEAGVPVVSGSTGWLPAHLDEVKSLTADGAHTLFWSSNFSIGVYLFAQLNKSLARLMARQEEYDVRMTEVHHVHKLDHPSGTAITLAEDIVAGIGRKDEWVTGTLTQADGTVVHEHEPSARQIAIDSVREGEVPGTHTICYDSAADSITIEHKAHSRQGFALGAVVAAEYAATHTGWLTMDDLMSAL